MQEIHDRKNDAALWEKNFFQPNQKSRKFSNRTKRALQSLAGW